MTDDLVTRLRRLGFHSATEAAAEIERLRRWKDEATAVITQWDDAWEAAGSPGRLGQSKAAAMAHEIAVLRAALQEIIDNDEGFIDEDGLLSTAVSVLIAQQALGQSA